MSDPRRAARLPPGLPGLGSLGAFVSLPDSPEIGFARSPGAPRLGSLGAARSASSSPPTLLEPHRSARDRTDRGRIGFARRRGHWNWLRSARRPGPAIGFVSSATLGLGSFGATSLKARLGSFGCHWWVFPPVSGANQHWWEDPPLAPRGGPGADLESTRDWAGLGSLGAAACRRTCPRSSRSFMLPKSSPQIIGMRCPFVLQFGERIKPSRWYAGRRHTSPVPPPIVSGMASSLMEGILPRGVWGGTSAHSWDAPGGFSRKSSAPSYTDP